MGKIRNYDLLEEFKGDETFVVETDEGTKSLSVGAIKAHVATAVEEKADMLNQNDIEIEADTDDEYKLNITVGAKTVTTPNLKGNKGDKGDPAELPENLRQTIVVYSDEEFEEQVAMIAENFTSLVPIEIIFGYDATETVGLSAGSSYLVIDSGSGNIEDAIIVPVLYCEEQFTYNQAQQLNKCNEFVKEYDSKTLWYPISDEQSSSIVIRNYADNSQLNIRDTRHIIFDLKFSGNECYIDINSTYNARIALSHSDYSDYADEDGYVLLHIDIQRCATNWLAEITTPNGAKTFISTFASGGSGYTMENLHIYRADMIYITNAYGRSI